MRLMHDLVGETLSGRYRLISRVAGGGMGDVYRGHDLLLDRTVAVKVLQAALAGDPDLVQRFRAEARAAARLTHPNVVAVHDWGSEGDHIYYMVMEYVSGTDLRDLLVSHGCLAPAQAAEVMISVCDALTAAHSTGLVHRDIKPENVLIARDGMVKVADFGIAAITDVDRTQPGNGLFGTLRYLSPEQAQGKDSTFSSDIWAAGAVLSELLTGRPPVNGSGTELLKRRAVEAPVEPSTLNPEIPQDLDAIVTRACAVDPADRYVDASEMATDLRRAAVRSLPDAPPLKALMEEDTGEIRLDDLEPTSFSRSARRGTRPALIRLLRPLTVLLFLVALGVGGAKAVGTFLIAQEVKVPSVVGMPRAVALEQLDEAGLEGKVVARREDLNAARGAVLLQDPATGELTEGSTVRLTLSAGPPTARVPAIINATLSSARVQLRTVHMKIGEIDKEFSLAPKGDVIEQSPARGFRPWGTKVNVVISRGPAPVSIPDVSMMKADRARQILKDAGFTVVETEGFSDEVPKGRVISTEPIAAATAPQGSEVTMVVSVGPQYKEVVMPDVRNMTIAAARARLEALNLRVRVNTSGDGSGDVVIDTHPLPGEKIRENDVVVLFTY